MKTKIFSILNITPDSFSDGGNFYNYKDAENEADCILKSSIDVIDVGAVATNPYVEKGISTTEELERLTKVLPKIIALAKKHNKLVSLDSYNYDVIRYGIYCGVHIINDQSAFQDFRIANLIRINSHKIKAYIFMHSLSLPVKSDENVVIPDNSNIIEYLLDWGIRKQNELIELGIPKEKLVFDPGLGFGKNQEQCIQILLNTDVFQKNGLQVMIGHSRKRFLTKYCSNLNDLDSITLLVSNFLVKKDIYSVRIHNYTTHSLLKNFSSTFM